MMCTISVEMNLSNSIEAISRPTGGGHMFKEHFLIVRLLIKLYFKRQIYSIIVVGFSKVLKSVRIFSPLFSPHNVFKNVVV